MIYQAQHPISIVSQCAITPSMHAEIIALMIPFAVGNVAGGHKETFQKRPGYGEPGGVCGCAMGGAVVLANIMDMREMSIFYLARQPLQGIW